MSSQDQSGGGDGVTAKVSGAVMLALVFVLFLVIVFVFFFYLYARRRMGRSTRFVFAVEHVAPHPGRGLDADVLRSLPVTVYRASDYKEGIECAVCLTELADGDEARLLPKCSHGFHLACIDMWFRSHTTCPLCRAPVGPHPTGSARSSDDTEESAGGPLTPESGSESPAFPSGVLFWGTEDHVNVGNSRQGPSSSGSKKPAGGALVIDIPSRAPEGAPSPLPQSKPATEEAKSPASTSSRFKSLTRLLSLGKRAAAGPSQSPGGGDIEQGHGASTPTPRTPSDP